MSTVSQKAEQYSLPYPDPLAVFLALVVAMPSDHFIRLLVDNCASWVIDIRVAPRFDTLMCLRDSAFRLFRARNVSYVDLFGRLGVRSYRSAASNPGLCGVDLCQLLSESDRHGPYVLLFDDQKLMLSAGNVLPGMLRGVLGENIHFSRVVP